MAKRLSSVDHGSPQAGDKLAGYRVSEVAGSRWGIIGTDLNHNTLANLTTGDPHTQYHNDARGNALYAPLAHASNMANPHGVSKAQVGLGSVTDGAEPNRVIASQVEAEAGSINTKDMTPLRTSQAITALAPVSVLSGQAGQDLTTFNVWKGDAGEYAALAGSYDDNTLYLVV